ncbi:DUF1900-domain-containing protein [Atractiella rhizophila]|nr:DUF1900-domain-containing protein [Atractiella rhizophila]
MARFVRSSSYRHVYGSPAKREKTYDNVRVSANAFDTDLVSANPLFLAVNYQVSGGGAFLVTSLGRTGKLPDIYPLCRGHTAPVLDTAWSPFDDYLIASCGEDCRVALTRIDPDVLEQAWLSHADTAKGGKGHEIKDLEPVVKMQAHQRKVGHVSWHPTANNVLATASTEIKLWDVEKGSAAIELHSQPDMVQSMAWDWTGSLISTTCRDKKFRLFDPRSGAAPVKIVDGHAGIKASRVAWMGSLDRIATTGFSKMSDREVKLWDSKNLERGPIKSITVDTSSGTLMPFWGEGNNILYLAGKGDGNIRYYEYENDDLFFLSEYKSSEPQRGMTFLPRRGLNVSECEIARAFKCSGTLIEPISFIVPRKSETFQSDIFPPAPSAKPALTSSEFFAGKTSAPIMLDLETQQASSAPAVQQHKQQSIPAPTPTQTAPAPAPAAAPAPVAAPAPTPVREQTIPAPVKKESTFVEERREEPMKMEGVRDEETTRKIMVLEDENARLKEELAERDHLIRNLELQLEQMKTNQKKVAEMLAL